MWSQFDSLELKIKKVIIQDSTSIYSDPGHAKEDELRENEEEQKESTTEHGQKKVVIQTLNINFTALLKSESEDVVYKFLLAPLSFDDIKNKRSILRIEEAISKIKE